MCVIIIILVRPHFLNNVLLFSQKLWALWINKYENLHYWKSKKSIAKNCKSIFYKTVNNMWKKGSLHNSMTEMCCAQFKYENKSKVGWNNWFTTC